MPKELTECELEQHLKEQIGFLQSSAKLYDLGQITEAKRIALTLRILLYDGGKPSLFSLLNLKKKQNLVSTAKPYSETNLLTQQCLVGMTFSSEGASFFPLFGSIGAKLISCNQWLQEIIIDDPQKNKYNRLDLILLLANQDGGAHVDKIIKDERMGLKDSNVSGWHIIGSNDEEFSFGNDVVYCSMRQMAFEILQSLYRIRPNLFCELYF